MTRIPASEEDRLSTAVREGVQSAHSPSSQRAEAAWDAIPGEEISVDFKDAGYEEIGGDECGDLLPGDENLPLAQRLGFAEKLPRGYLQGQVGQMLEVKPELSVDVYVNLPDGRSWNLNLAVPEDEEFSAEQVLALVVDHFDAVGAMLQRALGASPRRRALGLHTHMTVTGLPE